MRALRPLLADLTFARARNGTVYAHACDVEQALTVGDLIEVVDGEDVVLPARVQAIDPDGTVVALLLTLP